MRRSTVSVFAAIATMACACSGNGGDSVGAQGSAIVNGAASTASEDAVVLLMTHDPSRDTAQGPYYAECTGTLLSPRIVLTALHCIGHTDGLTTCDAHGNPIGSGSTFGPPYTPTDTHVFVGARRPGRIDPSTWPHAVQYVRDESATTLCNRDLALIILAEPVANALVAPVRLSGGVSVDEQLRMVGWGATNTVAFPTARQTRDGASVVEIGPSETAHQGGFLAAREFLASESVCTGDSGGPAFDSATGAVVGVTSRGPNFGDGSNGIGCLDTQHTFTTTSGFRELVLSAFAITGETPVLESKPSDRDGAVDDASSDAHGADDGGANGAMRSGCNAAPIRPRDTSCGRAWWVLAMAVASVHARRVRLNRARSTRSRS